MSAATQVIDLTIDMAEVRSVNDVSAKIVSKIGQFANHYGVGGDFDAQRTDEDITLMLVKKNQVGLRQLTIHVLEDGQIAVGSFSGRRIATLLINLHYVNGGRSYL